MDTNNFDPTKYGAKLFNPEEFGAKQVDETPTAQSPQTPRGFPGLHSFNQGFKDFAKSRLENFQNVTGFGQNDLTPKAGGGYTINEDIALKQMQTIAASSPGGIAENIPKVGGSILGKAKNLFNDIKGTFRGKTLEEVLATPESELSKLNPTERKAWFDNAEQQVKAKSETLGQNIKTGLQEKLLNSQKEAESLQKELATTTRDKVIELRPKITQAMGRQSETYRQLVSEELAPIRNNPINTTDLNGYIDNKFPDNPELAQATKQKLGTVEKVNSLSDPTSVVSKVKPQTTIGELYDRSQALKQTISGPVKSGTRVYTSEEKLTDDAISTLTDYLKSQGLDLKNARSFWAKYAPIRDQLVREAKPFLQTGTQTKTFASNLMRVAKGVDINNENFINEVENLVGEPIQKEAKTIVQKLDANAKNELATKMQAEADKLSIEMSKDKSLQNLSEKAFEVERQARFRTIMKRVLLTAGGIGVDRVIKKYTGFGI